MEYKNLILESAMRKLTLAEATKTEVKLHGVEATAILSWITLLTGHNPRV